MNEFTNNHFYLNRDLQENILANINSRGTNAIILAGPKGLGKNNFILKLSKYLLCKFESEDVEINTKALASTTIIKNKSFHLFDNNSHPDFYYLTKNEEKDNKNIHD